ncbi:type I-E CRISPR-associated protein Cas5/CasD [Spirochaeta cellobiosiphila]|uniref:type I-E CRISPR-associated protein Cas5/CasD n=1 Tax=Spirochaeta cellobiosiphila TaxID=504483 RepID=UPI0003F9A67E|nr:type I-E CRISPR-associated protein Cas5/CasD [Spirochaeta cellobiosiphila]
MKYLLLWLEGPFQSWGVDSKFWRRDSLDFPTKSGLFGLYLSALGARGSQEDLLAQLAEYKQNIFAYWKTENQTSTLIDFHMVGSGYDSKNSWQKNMIPKTIEGKSAVGGGAKLTYRYYLQDMAFGVIQELEDDLSYLIGKSLREPVFDLYLGRKNCIPSEILYRGEYDYYNEAEIELKKIVESISSDDHNLELHKSFHIKDGAFEDEGEVLTLNDIPIRFGRLKSYRDRQVTLVNYE